MSNHLARHVVFFPAIAAMCVFYNILLHPRADDAQADIDLLNLVGETLRRLPSHPLSPGFMNHSQAVGDFLLQLVEFGKCALSKAETEGQADRRTYPDGLGSYH